MNKIQKLLLKVMSSPSIDMTEDYTWIRKLQSFFSPKPLRKKDHIFDQKIYSLDGSHEIPVRIFYPEEKKYDDILLFFHGGGWVIGDIETYTKTCINMADLTGRLVFSVNYRLAPEHPYPEGFNDCYQATEWVLNNIKEMGLVDFSQVTLIGDSAGGNLVAAISQKLRDENKKIPAKQILIYPVTYWDHTDDSPFESIRTKGYDYGLTSKNIQEYMELYQPDTEKRKSNYISPLMADDLSFQPDTLVITSENDPLRDEGEAYGKALKEAGNNVVIHRVDKSAHNFITYPKFSSVVKEAYEYINRFLNQKSN